MPADQRINDELKFIETCVELKLLQQTDAQSLRDAVNQSGIFVAQEAMQRGLLTPADVDIVQSLRNPLRVVPGYEILGLVGRGGMGVVYRARQLDLDRIVALKTILISNVHKPTVAARFEREAKALARLQHPNIVQALNFGKHEGRYFFAMEFITGRSCEQAIKQQGLIPPPAVWSIVRQVASGLLHALRQNVIHRDIKPANLLLLPAPEGTGGPGGGEIVKITDFGLAMFADGGPEQMKLTTGEKIIGSPAYMSPEQFGGGSVDFRADIYSLGATAWCLMFGSPPFQGGSIPALLSHKTQPIEVDRATLPVKIPENQWRLLTEMLDPDVERRPPSYEALIDAIDEFKVEASSSVVEPTLGGAPVAANIAASQTAGDFSGAAISEQTTIDPSAASPGIGNGNLAAVAAEPGDPNAVSRTIELKQVVPAKSGRRHRMLAAGIAAAVVLIVIAFLIQFSGPGRGPRVYTRVVESRPLFDGLTLSGWDVGGSMVGAWNTVQAPDDSTAIACMTRQGALTRRVEEKTHPRISLFVWVGRDAGPVDIDFALDPATTADPRGCLRLSDSSIELGEKSEDFGALRSVAQVPAPSTIHDRFHVVHIERQPTDWYVFLEQRLVGTIPIDRVGPGSAIRLSVHRSDLIHSEPPYAFFSDVRLDNLARPSET